MSNTEDLKPEDIQQAVQQFENFEDFQNSQSETDTEPTEPEVEETTTEPEDDTDTETETDTEVETEEEVKPELSDSEFRKLVTSKFKANGVEMEFTDPNDIVKLMQYGANYHKKMAELAPNRRLLKALKDNDLLNEDKINDLIALSKKDKTAIAKFLKDNEVDTFDLPDLEETPYQRQNYLPSNSKIDFDEAVDELAKSEAGLQTIKYFNNLPPEEIGYLFNEGLAVNAMNSIKDHIESGLYAEANRILEQEKATGRVPEYDNQGNKIKEIDKYFFVVQHLQKTQQVPEPPKVVGNNLNKPNQVKQPNTQKTQASIPSNASTKSYSGVNELISTSEFDKYENWEDFLKAHNLQKD